MIFNRKERAALAGVKLAHAEPSSRAAWLDGLAPPLPPLRRQRPLHYSPEAWTPHEVLRLVAAANQLSGTFPRTGLPRGLWLGSLVRAGYDTGLRLGDLLRFPARPIGDSPILVRQAKTGRSTTERWYIDQGQTTVPPLPPL